MHFDSAVVLDSALTCTDGISMRFYKILFFANGEKIVAPTKKFKK